MKIFRELSSGIAIPNGGILKLLPSSTGEILSSYP